MIDLKAARAAPEEMRAALARKGAGEIFDELLAADQAVLEVQPRVEELRAARKIKGKPTPEQLTALERLKAELQGLEQQLGEAEARRQEILDRVPNPPDVSAPHGFTDEDAVEIRRWGDPPSFPGTMRSIGRGACRSGPRLPSSETNGAVTSNSSATARRLWR